MEYKHEIKWGDPLELKPYENMISAKREAYQNRAEE